MISTGILDAFRCSFTCCSPAGSYRMKNNEVGPDFFGFYTSEVAELLSQSEDLLPFPHQVSGKLLEENRKNGSSKNSRRSENHNHIYPSPLFSDGVGCLLSDFKRERFKALLRQAVYALSQEVEEIVNPVLSACRIRSFLRCKKSHLGSDASACEDGECAQKKLNLLPPSSIDDDLRFLLDNDSTYVDNLVNDQCSEFSSTLLHMEQKLEELLNTTMTSCRAMTIVEKEQLRTLIQGLTPYHLDGVANILGHSKPGEKVSSNEIHVDLDEEDNVTLWRLYFYAKSVQSGAP